MKFSHVLFGACIAAVAVSATPAMAHSILINGNPTVTVNGPLNNTFTYNPIVTSSSSVVSGTPNVAHTTFVAGQADFFILVDFVGYISGSAFAAPGWSATSQMTFGTNVSGNTYNVPTGTTVNNSQQFTDDPSIPDILFEYTNGGVANTIPGQANLGQFGARSTLSNFTFNSLLEAQDHSGTGGTIGNSDLYLAPGITSLGTPLPAAAWSGMSLLGLLGGAKILRRRR